MYGMCVRVYMCVFMFNLFLLSAFLLMAWYISGLSEAAIATAVPSIKAIGKINTIIFYLIKINAYKNNKKQIKPKPKLLETKNKQQKK